MYIYLCKDERKVEFRKYMNKKTKKQTRTEFFFKKYKI